jgi:hypothetical protein
MKKVMIFCSQKMSQNKRNENIKKTKSEQLFKEEKETEV